MTPDPHSDSPILLVEDNPFSRELLKKALARLGYPVSEAKNGKEALDQLQSRSFRLIFMDLLMPGMDGFETIRRIRRMGVRTPIIIASSMDDKQDRQQCLEAGGNDFLPKPFDLKAIENLVKTYEGSGDATGSDTRTSVNEGPERFSGFTVLLVEEDAALAERRVRFLTAHHFEVIRVRSGDKALAHLENRQHRTEIIISNLFTSGIDGLGILARVKRNRPELLVFIYAPEYDKDTFQLAVQLGADGVMTDADFEASILPAIESAVLQADQKGSRIQTAATAHQVRQAQANLIRYGCTKACDTIDIAYSPLTDAGGDLAHCRCFNLSNRCGVFLGDVSGHSVMSSYLSAFYLGVLTANWNRVQKPHDLLRTINHELNASDYREYHLCATALLWDRNRQRVEIGTAGNPGGLLAWSAADGGVDVRRLTGGGMCLGLLPQDDLFHRDGFRFPPETYLFLFTDGLREEAIEAALASGEIGLDRPSIHGLGQEIIDWTLGREGQTDDILLVTLRSPIHPPDMGCHRAFSSSYDGVDAACRWAETILTPGNLPPDKDPGMVMLILREALINAVQHGNRHSSGAFVDVSIYPSPNRLRIDVSDEGPGFDLPEPPRRIDAVDVLQSGGRGVAAMQTAADDITVTGGTVSLVFETPPT